MMGWYCLIFLSSSIDSGMRTVDFKNPITIVLFADWSVNTLVSCSLAYSLRDAMDVQSNGRLLRPSISRQVRFI